MKRLVAGGVTLVVLAVACGGKAPPPVAPVADRCPDFTKPDELIAFDYGANYALTVQSGDRLRAAVLSAYELSAFADRLDGDLGSACTQIAHDLGSKESAQTSGEACASALKSVQALRAKLGPKAAAKLVVHPSICSVDPSFVTKCATLCDSNLPSYHGVAACVTSASRCDGDCDGVCEPKSTMKCPGACAGTCDGNIVGECGGKCTGTCDGKRVNGYCAGVCTGTCAGGLVDATCSGKCSGACTMGKPGLCDGQCSGKCSVEFANAKCTGELKTPEISGDCRTRCELLVINKSECSDAAASFVVAGVPYAATKDADTLKAAIDKASPDLVKVLANAGPKGVDTVTAGQALIDGVRGDFGALAKTGRNPAASAAQLAKCFAEPLKKASADAATVKSGLEVAAAIRDAAINAAPPSDKP